MTLQKRKKKRLSVPSSERMTGRGKGKVEREGEKEETERVSQSALLAVRSVLSRTVRRRAVLRGSGRRDVDRERMIQYDSFTLHPR